MIDWLLRRFYGLPSEEQIREAAEQPIPPEVIDALRYLELDPEFVTKEQFIVAVVDRLRALEARDSQERD